MRASFENDTLCLTGERNIILNLEIKNNSDSIFVFHPNAIFNIYEEFDGHGFSDRFGIHLDNSERLEKEIEVLPGNTISIKIKFGLNDQNLSFMAKDQLFQKKYSFSVVYISPLLNKKREKRIVLSSKRVKAFVKKYKY